ncbi:M48 family metalloprotease [Candidatus Micrarchaeota archaeon]|nr:M48 family metalloprotease [Candidatus Micrarchaeota archaeon]
MFEMWDHLVFGIEAFLQNSTSLTLSSLSIALALLIIIKLRDQKLDFRVRLGLIYAHLSLISFPAVLLASTLTCASIGAECPVTIARAGLLLFPISILMSMAIGWLMLPRFYRFGTFKSNKFSEFIGKEAKQLGIKMPPIYVLDSQKVMAYSIGGLTPAIFMSLGMQELLSKKEIEAVLLHELNHLANGSAHIKISLAILNRFSPLARAIPIAYSHYEEKRADDFAKSRQLTKKFLEGARRKAEIFD